MIMDELAEHEVVYSAIKSSEKRTNFERIKNMSVEEMAEFISYIVHKCDESCIECEFSGINNETTMCPYHKHKFINWLNSESEE